MALPTKIVNPETGEEIVFDESASTEERLVWDEVRPAHIEPPPVHYHPDTEERFEVSEGRLVVEIDGEVHQIGADEEVVIPPATPHVSYTEAESARFRRAVTPSGQWRAFLTARFAAVHAVGELSGVTGLLQTVLLVRAYPNVVVPAQPPRALQRVMFPILAVVARIVGLKSHHQYPRDVTGAREERSPETTP
ncbi:cupin domain-containing protein [Halopenitus persicus]|uniref:cupin domain-containing protein n=1 Tax=Halopenitus persicus TaxID=1048396 RepID=UPI000BBB5EC8|nr:cupin domain-containing protein [Halopenitus persicus]